MSDNINISHLAGIAMTFVSITLFYITIKFKFVKKVNKLNMIGNNKNNIINNNIKGDVKITNDEN